MAATDLTSAAFEAAARAVLDGLPAVFAESLADIVVNVAEFATPDQLAAVGLDDPMELTGLYEGVPLPEQSQWDYQTMPPMITLFRQPLLAEMRETGVSFADLIRHVVIHEAGHHFGFSDEDMHALEKQSG